MSADITPKLILSRKTLSFRDFSWPRHATRKWLTKEKIDQVACQPIYLVPKGDKYWKISYANYENEILKDIDDNNTCRKRCLKIMKKKLMLWKKKSNTNFEGLSSYLLKTTLLWMCEKFPNDKDWSKGKLDNCYRNFLHLFAYRLRKRNIGEYFNPSVNLLENKDEDCIDELIEFIDKEYTSLSMR
ncbi:cyclic GMP-AMP synthase-like [Mercenaria mercenaria]|uniref:cyclic GMP-AMP synthase-like n=1 Tax=Mercenaria mercenaria TaxID=6596 RepID=UPI00234F4C5D|nr:cyclic GMP-AMP synthase-like [Mercenaria mercenaria]